MKLFQKKIALQKKRGGKIKIIERKIKNVPKHAVIIRVINLPQTRTDLLILRSFQNQFQSL